VTQADQTLVIRSQSGDRAAFEQIVGQTARLVYSKLALDTGDRHRAEDLTQEVYLIAWRSIRELAKPEALRAWLLAIAASVLADDVRRMGRKKRSYPRLAAEYLDTAADPSAADPAQSAQKADDRERVLDALRGLPESYRQALSLRYLAGADYETIARQLALSNGSLRGLLHRGLDLLRKRMTEEIE